MKVWSSKSSLTPVTIELETEDELSILNEVLRRREKRIKIASIINKQYSREPNCKELKESDIREFMGSLKYKLGLVYEEEWARRSLESGREIKSNIK